MSKFLKWIYGNKSEHNNFYYNIDEVTVANEWNPKSTDFYSQGGLILLMKKMHLDGFLVVIHYMML